MARHGAQLRRAAVAQWEVRLRVPAKAAAWRVVVSLPTGDTLLLLLVVCLKMEYVRSSSLVLPPHNMAAVVFSLPKCPIP